MDFNFTTEEKDFRAQVRAFLDREVSDEFLSDLEEQDEVDFSREFTRKLAQKGWLAMAWPKEYGGGGATTMEQLIFNEEMGYHHAPTGGHRQGISLIGPCLIAHGTEEQKRKYLPPITAGEVVWCQGFSEPNAGSDLASLQCQAVEDGDDIVITGQKVWTTNGHRADWCHLLARTDPDAPKHKGISYFLMDMKSPGITARPLLNMLASRDFGEIFFDEVRVPKENILGEKNRGWYVSQTTLNFERSGITWPASAKRDLELLIEYAKETKRNGQSLAQDPLVRHKLTESKGQIPIYEAAMSELFGSELLKRLGNVGMQILGLFGPLERGSRWAPLRGRIARDYQFSLGLTIARGTSEIQKNIIAWRGLELPRV